MSRKVCPYCTDDGCADCKICMGAGIVVAEIADLVAKTGETTELIITEFAIYLYSNSTLNKFACSDAAENLILQDEATARIRQMWKSFSIFFNHDTYL